MMQAVQAQSVETWFSSSTSTGIERPADRSSALAGGPSPDRMRAAAFDLALQDELARDRSFHILDGQFRLRESTVFDGAEPDQAPEAVDPSKARGVSHTDLADGSMAPGPHGRVVFEAEVGGARKTDGGDRSSSDFESSADSAFWIGNDLAVSPIFASGVSDFQETLPVDTDEADRVFFNGDGRPILVSGGVTTSSTLNRLRKKRQVIPGYAGSL